MIKRDQFVYEENTSIWTHLVDLDFKDVVVLSVHKNDGKDTISPNEYNWDVVDGMIKLDFGANPESGYAIFSYDDGKPDVSVDANGGVIINNNINCCGGSTPTGTTF